MSGIAYGWLPANVAYVAALQDLVDRAVRHRRFCGVCGEPVAWNQAGTRLHHFDRRIIDHRPAERLQGATWNEEADRRASHERH